MRISSSFAKQVLIFIGGVFVIIGPFLSSVFTLPSLHPLSNSNFLWGSANRKDGFHSYGLLQPAERDLNLAKILMDASMPNKNVIITTLNQAWAAENAMIGLFLESFRIGNGTAPLLKHLIIVALDQKAYECCQKLHKYCFELRTEGVDFSGEKAFMTVDYLRMMWTRLKFLGDVIEAGYNVLFTDADILWFRNPFLLFSPEADFQTACVHYVGNPKSLKNRANGGFTFARSNKRTLGFYRYWYTAKEVFPHKHDQDVLNKIKRDDALVELGLQWRFLDTKHISGFCEPSQDVDAVYTMHANCCYNLETKLADLRLIVEDWRRLASMSQEDQRKYGFHWSAPKACPHF